MRIRARFLIGSLVFAITGAVAAQLPGIDAPTGAAGAGVGSGPRIEHKVEGSGALDTPADLMKDALKLCDRLGGMEREICVRQAQENSNRAPAAPIGATPGSGARGSTDRGAAPR